MEICQTRNSILDNKVNREDEKRDPGLEKRKQKHYRQVEGVEAREKGKERDEAKEAKEAKEAIDYIFILAKIESKDHPPTLEIIRDLIEESMIGLWGQVGAIPVQLIQYQISQRSFILQVPVHGYVMTRAALTLIQKYHKRPANIHVIKISPMLSALASSSRAFEPQSFSESSSESLLTPSN